MSDEKQQKQDNKPKEKTFTEQEVQARIQERLDQYRASKPSMRISRRECQVWNSYRRFSF